METTAIHAGTRRLIGDPLQPARTGNARRCGIITRRMPRARTVPRTAAAGPRASRRVCTIPGRAPAMPSTEPRGPRQIARAFKWSIAGMRAAWRHEASFRLEGWLFAVLFPLGLWLGGDALERAMLCGSLLLVLSA